MAANKFATMLHKNSHKFTLILIYAILEWILIFLLLVNSLLSYLIAKFADYFGLKPPCLWCSRVDHIIDPSKSKNCYRDLICETHAAEISELGYCLRHRKLVESHDMCEDCSSSRQGKSMDVGGKISFFSWVKEMGLGSGDGEKKVENGEKMSRCSCCDVSLDRELYPSPYVLFKPSWGVLDYTQKGNFLTETVRGGGDGGESSDPCKSDCHSDHCEEEYGDRGNKEERKKNGLLFDFHEGVRRNDQEKEGEEEEEAGCFRSTSSVCCKEFQLDEDDVVIEVGGIEQETPFDENDENLYVDDDTHIVLQSPDIGSRSDASFEIMGLRLDYCSDLDDHRVFPIELIDSTTLKKQVFTSFKLEEEGNWDGILEPQSPIEKQDEVAADRRTTSEQEETMVCLADESKDEVSLAKVQSMDKVEDGIFQVSPIEDHKEGLVVEVCNEVASAQATGTLSCNGDVVERAEVVVQNFDGLAACEEDPSNMSADESINHTHCHEPTSSLTSEIPNESSLNSGEGVSINSNAFINENDQGTEQTETVARLSELSEYQVEEERAPETPTYVEGLHNRSLVILGTTQTETVERLSLRSENEVEEERAPETPTYVDGLHNLLHKKSLSFDRKGSVTEESIDGSVISEFEHGEGSLTVERLKSALKAEHKALTALYAELEEERSASAIAANQTMAMITRLQEEKAMMQMEALQYQRMMEEQSEYDQEALQLMNELMVKREKEKQELEKELEACRKKLLRYEAKEKRMMRNRSSSEKSRTSSVSSSNVDSDELSIDLNHENIEDDFFGHQETSNGKTPPDVVVHLENIGLEGMKHLSTLDESLAEFEDERRSILEQLKALEEKLFILGEEKEEFEAVGPTEHLPVENGEFNGNFDFNSEDVHGLDNGFSDDLGEKHYQEKRNMGVNAKRLLPLFDAIGMEDGDEGLIDERGSNAGLSQNSSVSKFSSSEEKIALEEEVDHMFERLQALEADREFLKHCIGSLKKGDKGMDLLQEILQHLRDLRSVEQRVKNMGDHPTL